MNDKLKNLLSPVFNYFEASEKLNDDLELDELVKLEAIVNREYDKVLEVLPLIKKELEEL